MHALFSSVPEPFKGDYLNVTRDMKWRKVISLVGDVHLVFADLVYKVNRADGKVSLSTIETEKLLGTSVIRERSISLQ